MGISNRNPALSMQVYRWKCLLRRNAYGHDWLSFIAIKENHGDIRQIIWSEQNAMTNSQSSQEAEWQALRSN